MSQLNVQKCEPSCVVVAIIINNNNNGEFEFQVESSSFKCTSMIPVHIINNSKQ